MWRKASILAVLIVLTLSAIAGAEWRIDIESKTVNPGQTNVTLDITAYWDLDLVSLALPLIVREIDPGSFWMGNLPFDTAGNATNHPFVQGVSWNWSSQWAVLTEQVRPSNFANAPCQPAADTLYDGISPDNLAVVAGGIFATPAEPDGRDVVTITFDVTVNPGAFEFDTSCFSTSLSTIFMIDSKFPPVDHGPTGLNEVVFNKGTITIAETCACPGQGDVNDDGSINPVDIVHLIQYALQGGLSPVADPHCPIVNRGDWDCNNKTNLADIVVAVNYVYRQSTQHPCDPCVSGPTPTNPDTLRVMGVEIQPGDTATIDIMIVNTQALGGYSIRLAYDTSVVDVIPVSEGETAVRAAQQRGDFVSLNFGTPEPGITAGVVMFPTSPEGLAPGRGVTISLPFYAKGYAPVGSYTEIVFVDAPFDSNAHNWFALRNGLEQYRPVRVPGTVMFSVGE